MNTNLIASILAVFVGFCALCISVCVLGVSIWQGFEMRKNYRLSVTPNICVDGKWTGTDDIAGISLINKGIGPAIIKSIVIQHLNEEFDYLSQTRNFVSHLYQLKKFNPDLIINVLTPGEYLAPGEKFPLIYLKKPNKEETAIFTDNFAGITITVIYKSIYGNSYKTYFTAKI